MSATVARALTLLLALIPVAARAAITPDAEAIVGRYLEATGGRAAALAERTVHTRGQITAFGLVGTVESWTARPHRRASVTTIGPFTLREGSDGMTAWRIDQNGKFARRDGRDLEDAKASNWFENEMWALPDQGGGGLVVAGEERDSLGTYDVLELRPPAGKPRRYSFDRKTGLLTTVVLKDDQNVITTRLAGWQRVAGRLRPRVTMASVSGMPMNDARLTLDSVWVNEPIDEARFAPPAAAAADVRWLGKPGFAELPFRYESRHLWVPVSINGAPPEDFLLDTGASITVIDSATAVRHRLQTEGRLQGSGAGALGTASFSRIDSLQVAGPGGAGVVLSGQKVAVLSLNPYLEPFFWKPTAGVLGYDFISRFVMGIDYDQKRLTLHDPASFQYQGKGTAIPLTLAGNVPVVKAKLDGRYKGEFRLDIGSGSTVDLHSPFVKQHQLASSIGRTISVIAGGFGGTFTTQVGRMKTMEIGPFGWSDPLVSLSSAQSGGFASEDVSGNIGNHLLERFRCTFDYERRVVHLEPSSRFGRRDRFSMSGVLIAKMDGEYRAAQILPDSPAAKAGLLAYDEVVSVDGRPIAEWSQDELGRRFEEDEPGTRHTIEVRRQGTLKKIVLTLKEML